MSTQAKQRLEQVQKHLSPSNMSQSEAVFPNVALAPPDAIFQLTHRYVADKNPKKINLGVGAYRTNEGKPYVLPTVKKASRALEEQADLDHEYLPITGLPEFTKAAQGLVFGKNCTAVNEDRVISVQTLSGTGANHLGALFFARFYDFPTSKKEIYVSNPSWANHHAIITSAGNEVSHYRYYNKETIGLDFEGYVADLEDAPERSVFLVHGCAHNPTGVDPTEEQWNQLLEIFLRKKHYAFFDSAYQGFATGDLDRDAASMRLFAEKKVPMLVCQSFSKNAGLYSERAGALHVVASSPDEAQRVKSQLSQLQRAEISNPPAYGARVVTKILTQPELFESWKQDITGMSSRIIEVRHELFKLLNDKYKTPGPGGRKDWKHILEQIGMFSFTGLNPEQTKRLVEEYSIYLTANGRISMAGLNSNNIETFAKAVDDVVRGNK